MRTFCTYRLSQFVVATQALCSGRSLWCLARLVGCPWLVSFAPQFHAPVLPRWLPRLDDVDVTYHLLAVTVVTRSFARFDGSSRRLGARFGCARAAMVNLPGSMHPVSITETFFCYFVRCSAARACRYGVCSAHRLRNHRICTLAICASRDAVRRVPPRHGCAHFFCFVSP
jgi:hypothetical protein